MSSTYLEQLGAYARWWRDTPGAARALQGPARLASARAASLWYRDLGLDPRAPVPVGAPRITRAMLQDHAGAFVGDLESIADGGYLGRTSGTTGEPVEVMMCAWSLAHYYMHLEWGLGLAGQRVPVGARIAYVSVGTRAAPGDEAAPLWGGRVARIDGATPRDVDVALGKFKPDFISGTPSDMAAILEVASHESWAQARAIVVTSEHVSTRLYAHLKSMAPQENIIILNSYGLSEVGPVAWECPHESPTGRAWHVPPGSGSVERLDGELVVTTWRNRAMPLTRYATGDGVERVCDAHRCDACGHRGQSFWGLMGRAMRELYDADGAQVSPVLWIRALNDASFGVRQHKIIQPQSGVLRVTCQMPQEHVSALRERLQGLMSTMHIEFVLDD
jgi:phenylacetate-coenzyme A ligase PaaK-like adenylate-forming protein